VKQGKPEPDNRSFLFQLDVLVNADTNGEALEQLIRVLNSGKFADYRIGSGIELGRVIEDALAQQKKSAPSPASANAAQDKASVAAAVAKAKDAVAKSRETDPSSKGQTTAGKGLSAAASEEMVERIRQFIETNKLIRLNVNKGRGVKLSIPCRVISLDMSTQLLTVYHVDEKQVHSLKLYEIDDFVD
jgi:nucleotide-binding universal stress UspA family protein